MTGRILAAAGALCALAVSASAGDARPLQSGAAQARELAAQAQRSRRERRDAVLSAWAASIETFCGERPCPPERREALLDRLAGMLERMPPFLRGTRADAVAWRETPGRGAPDGGEDGRSVTLFVPAEASPALAEEVLAHELAHVWERGHRPERDAFLALRHGTEAFGRDAAELWLHVMRLNNGELSPPFRLDAEARRRIAALGFPRRRPDDLHALTSPREYWAVSVELAFRAWRKGDWGPLKAALSEDEVEALKALFSAQ